MKRDSTGRCWSGFGATESNNYSRKVLYMIRLGNMGEMERPEWVDYRISEARQALVASLRPNRG